MTGIERARYAELFGPTVGDRIRLADTDLLIEVTEDRSRGPAGAGSGDEVIFGGGRVIRESMGQGMATRADGAPDLVITGRGRARPLGRDQGGRRRPGRPDRGDRQGRQPGHDGRRRPGPGDRPVDGSVGGQRKDPDRRWRGLPRALHLPAPPPPPNAKPPAPKAPGCASTPRRRARCRDRAPRRPSGRCRAGHRLPVGERSGERGGAAAGVGSVAGWLVNSAAAPLAGDDLELVVHIGPGARLTLSGVAATLALPGHRFDPSQCAIRLHAAEHADVAYLPEPTVITGRARHVAVLHAELGQDARLRTREVLVLGRAGERPGRLTTATTVLRAGRPVLRQRLEIGDPALDASPAYLAGRTVLATEIVCRDSEPPPAVGGEWWARTPLAAGGWICTALAHDAVTALKCLDNARCDGG